EDDELGEPQKYWEALISEQVDEKPAGPDTAPDTNRSARALTSRVTGRCPSTWSISNASLRDFLTPQPEKGLSCTAAATVFPKDSLISYKIVCNKAPDSEVLPQSQREWLARSLSGSTCEPGAVSAGWSLPLAKLALLRVDYVSDTLLGQGAGEKLPSPASMSCPVRGEHRRSVVLGLPGCKPLWQQGQEGQLDRRSVHQE
ncbi:hypothetical protein Celaphus_00012620, partial [Cervus elaphus hippelaphus]